jgi:hypothetical protein
MQDRLRPWLALLISALVHAGVACFLLGQANRAARESGSAALPGPVLMLRVLSPAQPARLDRAAQAAEVARADTPVPPTPPAERADLAAAETNDAGGSAPDEREKHYFGAGAMTQQPEVAAGMVAGRLLVVPGITPQTVSLQVWISDEGRVERIALDSPMSDKEEQMLLAAFAGVKFQPGRIGRIAVRGHLAMRVMLDYDLRL